MVKSKDTELITVFRNETIGKSTYSYNQRDFVYRFKNLLCSQMKNECYSDALKAFKRFKIHGLNSMNPENIKPHFQKILSQSKEMRKVSDDTEKIKLDGIYSDLLDLTLYEFQETIVTHIF